MIRRPIKMNLALAFMKVLACALITTLYLLSAQAASAEELPKKVLIFSSDSHSVPGNMLLDQAVSSTVRQGLPQGLQVFYEALDTFRIPNEQYEDEMVKLLQRKYSGESIDLIYAFNRSALKFLLKHREEVFSNTPVVFISYEMKRVADLSLDAHVTGVGGRVELSPTLDIALTLQPQTERVVVVAGKMPADNAFVEQARQEFKPYESKVEFVYLIGLSIEELQTRLASLPDQSIVFYLWVSSDSTPQVSRNPELISLLAPSSSAPIYGTSQTYMGNGMIGGRLVDFEALGNRAGQMGLRILAGESPQNIPLQTIPNVAMFDWRQLRRWGIDETKLPPGSIVRYREFSVWELYKWRIVGAVVLIILQALFIVWLLINRERRRRAEEVSKVSEARYRNVVDTQTELICRYQPDTTLTFVNDAYCRYFGKTSEELIGTKFSEFLPEHARAGALAHIASLIENPRSEIYEYEVVRPNGEAGWQEWLMHVAQSTKGDGVELQGIGHDTTEKRQAEEELRQSETRFRHMADTSEIFIWIADPNMLCTYFNRRVLDFTGRTLDQLLGQGWLEIIHPDDVQRCVDTYAAGYEKRESFVLEFRIRRADGEFRWVYDTGSPRLTADGELIGYIGSAVDITDRRTAEEALQIAHAEVSKLKNQLEEENIYLREEIKLAHDFDQIVGRSDATKYVLFKIEQVAPTDTRVLITGETGTGKELVAHAIHSSSSRRDRPLVKVNCAALSPTLIESELFGHEKGSFTGATARKAGRFELANGATIFLDEIGELPLELQAKLLRVIQENEFERLGSSKTIQVDARIIAATNRNLKIAVEQGSFREDLWYRLNVFPITVPPLRDRKEDIPGLVEHFVKRFAQKVGRRITSIAPATMRTLQNYNWPGNVRELANVVERAVINTNGSVLRVVDNFEPAPVVELLQTTRTLEEIEKEYIIRILDNTAWRIEGHKGAAKILGLNPSTLRTRMSKLGIQKVESKTLTSTTV
jgi:formate hydrogenlyase transcriptional activator